MLVATLEAMGSTRTPRQLQRQLQRPLTLTAPRSGEATRGATLAAQASLPTPAEPRAMTELQRRRPGPGSPRRVTAPTLRRPSFRVPLAQWSPPGHVRRTLVPSHEGHNKIPLGVTLTECRLLTFFCNFTKWPSPRRSPASTQ